MIIYTVTLHDYGRTEVVGTFSGIVEACTYLGATVEDLEAFNGYVEDENGTTDVCVFVYSPNASDCDEGEAYTITMTILDDLVLPDNTGCCDASDSGEVTEDCCDSFIQ